MSKEDLKMPEYMVGLDIGTSSVKAVAFDRNGTCLGKKSAAYPTRSLQPGWQEQEPEVVFQTTLRCLKNLISGTHGLLAGITFSSAMHSIMALDKKGVPLTRCILWSDNRSAAIAEKLKGTVEGKTIYRHTGTPVHAMTPLNKIAWLRQNEPVIFQQTWKFAGIKEYLVFRLTGQMLCDYSIASASGLFDSVQCNWFQPALEFAGIDIEKMPAPVPPEFKLEIIKPEFAKYLNITPETALIIGASDGCLANLGAGATNPGEAVLTIGTSAALRMSINKPAIDPKERIFNYLLTEKQFITGGASNNGGVVYEWFTRQFFGAGPADKRMKTRQEKLSSIPAGCEGLLFIPYILGERAPVWNARSRGGFYGIAGQHTISHFHKSVLEGILLNMSIIGEVLEQVVAPMDLIYANGGFVKMTVWVQMAADIFGKKICMLQNSEASAMGAAILGMKALGLLEDYSWIKDGTSPRQIFHPNQSNHLVYRNKREELKEIYGLLNATMLQTDGY